MTVSAITQVTEEGVVTDLSSFMSGGELYLAWATAAESPLTQLRWKKHTAAYGADVFGQSFGEFKDISVLGVPSDSSVVVAYSDSTTGWVGTKESSIYVARFSVATGAVITPPSLLGYGMKPALSWRGGVVGGHVLLTYASAKRGSVYLRESQDGGSSWTGERPVLANYVNDTVALAVAPFDDTHLSIIQVARSSRTILELGSLTRTRPIVALAGHPTDRNTIFATEPSCIASSLNDNLRGRLLLSRDGSRLFGLSGIRLGTSDGINAVMRLNVEGRAPVVFSSQSYPGSTPGEDLGSLTTYTLSQDAFANCFGATTGPVAVDVAVSDAYGYVVGNKEVAPTTTGGAIDVIRLSDMTSARVVDPNGTVFGHAVAVGGTTSPVVFVAVSDVGQEKLRIYSESGLAPTLRASHKMPARVNRILAVMDGDESGNIYVSMSDRLNVYRVSGLTSPIRLVMTVPMLSYGSFYGLALTSKGYIVAAMGLAGVGIFDQIGNTVASTPLSGVSASPWEAGKVRTLGSLVRPSAKNMYAYKRTYFRCTVAGTSQVGEPAWGPTGTITDGSASWQEVGPYDATILDVLVDENAGRIYAAGVLGGPTGTGGRVYTLASDFVGKGLPLTPTPQSNVLSGTYTTPKTVTLTCSDASASIYYTMDGSEPTSQSSKYMAPIDLGFGGYTWLRAVAIASNKRPSNFLDVYLTLNLPVAQAPTATASYGASTVTMALASVDGASIYYTTDGSAPTTASSLYTAPFDLPSSPPTRIRAISAKYGMSTSAEMDLTTGLATAGLTFQTDFSDPNCYPGSGNVIKDTISNSAFTLSGTITNGILSLNGSQWVNTGKTPSALGIYNTSYSLQLVFRVPNVSGDKWVVGEVATGTQLCLHAGIRGNLFYFAHYAADISVGTVSPNTWYVCTYVQNNGTGIIYVNGVQAYSGAMAPLLGTAAVMIGNANNSNFTGDIRYIGVFSRALSAAEVAGNYQYLKTRYGI